MEQQITCADVQGKRVLEVGSFDVNGSPRTWIQTVGLVGMYLGIDSRPGPGVDVVMPACSLVSAYGEESFDVVVSTEMLEHADSWRCSLGNMDAVLRPGGVMLVTTRSPGFPRHDHPGDYWRFTLDDFAAIFQPTYDVRAIETDPLVPGVFFCGIKHGEMQAVTLLAVSPQPAPQV